MATILRASVQRSIPGLAPTRSNVSNTRSRHVPDRRETYCSSARPAPKLGSGRRIAISMKVTDTKLLAGSRRAYSSEMANALVEVSKNIGMGSAAIGLGGASIGIGLVFASFLSAVARNPSYRKQLFTYAILGFGFVEAMGLFDLMVAMMCKYV